MQLTHKSDGAADVGVEVAASCIDVGLGSRAALSFGQPAEQDAFSDHYLYTEEPQSQEVKPESHLR